MRAPVGTVATETVPSYSSGTEPVIPQGDEADTGPASPDEAKKAPTYSDTTPQTLSEIYQGYLASIGSGTLGGGIPMNGSLQPEAPQAPGNVLTRMGGMMQGRGKWVLLAVVVIALIWWFNRKKG